jgi:hypothetical protein
VRAFLLAVCVLVVPTGRPPARHMPVERSRRLRLGRSPVATCGRLGGLAKRLAKVSFEARVGIGEMFKRLAIVEIPFV